MKKNFVTGIVVGGILFGGAGALAGYYTATDNVFPIQLNGNNVKLTGYNIEGSTYFKLRDIANVVGGFTVGFENNTIQLTKDGYTVPSTTSTLHMKDVLSAPLDMACDVIECCPDGDWYTSGNFYYKYDSATDGIFLNWCARNLSDKTIKYLHATVRLHNSVGDIIIDNVGYSSFTFDIVGPIESKDVFRCYTKNAFAFTNLCDKVSIDEISIEYTDGTIVNGLYDYSTNLMRLY